MDFDLSSLSSFGVPGVEGVFFLFDVPFATAREVSELSDISLVLERTSPSICKNVLILLDKQFVEQA